MGKIASFTKDAILEVCEQLASDGQAVSAVNVRHRLGGGSYTVIVPAIKEFKGRMGEDVIPAPQIPSPPQPISDLTQGIIARVWAEAWAICQKEIEVAEAKFKTALEAQAKELEAARSELDETYSQLQKNESEIEQLKLDLGVAQDGLQKKTGETLVLTNNLEAAKKEVKANQDRIEKIQTDCAKNLETKVQEIQSKTRELDQLKAKTEILEKEFQSSKSELGAVRDSSMRKEGELTGVRDSFSVLQKANEALTERAVSSEKEAQQLKSTIEKLEAAKK